MFVILKGKIKNLKFVCVWGFVGYSGTIEEHDFRVSDLGSFVEVYSFRLFFFIYWALKWHGLGGARRVRSGPRIKNLFIKQVGFGFWG